MKLRFGFVSNSSTTSFCIYGFSIEQGTDLTKAGIKEAYDFECIPGIVVRGDPWGDSYYIGRSIHAMAPDQTRAQFEKETEELFRSNFPDFDFPEFDHILEAWRDG
jgi:hypothetical protein